MASRRPASQLKMLDLPTFGLPTITTCGTPIYRFARVFPPTKIGGLMLSSIPDQVLSIGRPAGMTKLVIKYTIKHHFKVSSMIIFPA